MSIIEDIELTPQFKEWIDECCKVFGGLDICGLDFLHSKDNDSFYILELNDTAIGLVHKHEEEDMKFMRDLVLLRMQQAWGANEQMGKTEGKLKKKKKKTKNREGQGDKSAEEELQLLKIQLGREKEENEKLKRQIGEAAASKKKKGLFNF